MRPSSAGNKGRTVGNIVDATLPPKMFISYRWSNPNHEEWVLALATALVSLGVDVQLDKWHLREGQDALAFMESMVTDPTIEKVLLICDEGYVFRADDRVGGVGVESQIVSSRVYNSTDQTIFAAAVLQYGLDGNPLLPVYLTSRIYFDLSTAERYASGVEQIVRWCYGRPFYVAPQIGKRPDFIDNQHTVSSAHAASVSRLRISQSIGGKGSVEAATEVLKLVSSEASSLLMKLVNVPDADEKIIDCFMSSVGDLENVYQSFSIILNGSNKAVDIIHTYLDGIGKLWDEHPVNVQYSRLDNDALRMFVYSSLVGLVAVGIKEKKFTEVADILSIPFFRPQHSDRTGKASAWFNYCDTFSTLNSVRNARLKINCISVFADTVMLALERSKTVTFNDFMQADLTLHLKQILVASASNTDTRWIPMTGVYATRTYGSLPLFIYAESKTFWSRVEPLLGVDSVSAVKSALAPYKTGEAKSLRFDYEHLDLPRLFNVDQLATR